MDWDLHDWADEDIWEGEYRGTMRLTDEGIHATVVGEYHGTGALLPQCMKIPQKNRGSSIAFSGAIFEYPGNRASRASARSHRMPQVTELVSPVAATSGNREQGRQALFFL